MAGEGLERMEEGAGSVMRGERERRSPGAVPPVEACVRRDGDEPRERLGVITDVSVDDREAVDSRGTIARDRDDGRIAEGGDDGRSLGCRRSGDRHGIRERPQELSTLIERDRVGMNLAHLGQLDQGRPDEAVVHRQDRLGHDRECRLVEKVVRLRDGPDERALDGENAVGHAPRGDGVDHVDEGRQGDEAGGGEEPVAGGCRMGAFAAGIGDDEFGGCHGVVRAFRWKSVSPGGKLDGAWQGRRRRLARKGEAEPRAGKAGERRASHRRHRVRAHARDRKTASPTSAVELVPPRSGVRASARATSTARSSAAASSCRSSP